MTIKLHIDDIVETYIDEETNEEITEPATDIYFWYPNVTLYLKKQVDAQEAGSILTSVYNALYDKYSYTNVGFNEIPKVTDVISTIQNASNFISYIDYDGIILEDKTGISVIKQEITRSYTKDVEITADATYTIDLGVGNYGNIQYNTVKIVDSNNNVIGYDNGNESILSQNNYLASPGTIDYTTGEITLEFATLPVGSKIPSELWL